MESFFYLKFFSEMFQKHLQFFFQKNKKKISKIKKIKNFSTSWKWIFSIKKIVFSIFVFLHTNLMCL